MTHKLYALATDMRKAVSLDVQLLKEECEEYTEIVKGLEKNTGVEVALHPEWPRLYFLFKSSEDRKTAWWYLRKVVEPLEIIGRMALVDEETYQKSFNRS